MESGESKDPEFSLVGSTANRWELAARLRQLRQQSGLTLEEVALQVHASVSKISRLENNQRGPQVVDIRNLAALYNLSPIETGELIDLARPAEGQSPWRRFDELRGFTRMYIGLESAASTIRTVELSCIQGLFQTPAYARAMLSQPIFSRHFTEDGINQLVAAKVQRQTRLVKDIPLQIHAILGEAALFIRVGSNDAMTEQVAHLIAIADLPNVQLQILPFVAAGPLYAASDSFAILGMPHASVTDIVHIEGFFGQVLIDRDEEIERYRELFDEVAEKALPNAESMQLLAGAEERWRNA